MDARGLPPWGGTGLRARGYNGPARELPGGTRYELHLARGRIEPPRQDRPYRARAHLPDLARHTLEAPARNPPPVDARARIDPGISLRPRRALEAGVRERPGQAAARGTDLRKSRGNTARASRSAAACAVPAALRPPRGRTDRLHLRSLPRHRRA